MNFTKNFKSVKIRFYNVTSNCEVFASTVENDFSAIDYAEATAEWEQWAVEDCDSDTEEDSEAAGDS